MGKKKKQQKKTRADTKRARRGSGSGKAAGAAQRAHGVDSADSARGARSKSAAPTVESTAERVARLIAAGSSRSALETAKREHADAPTDASEALLVRAYFARVRALLEKQLTTEARALLDTVARRHAAASTATPERCALEVAAGRIDPVVAPLAEPDVDPAAAARIETAIRAELVDLDALANASTLPAEHPLRAAARAVARAFAAVATRPVEDDELALREVSRRSPLAPWRMLIHALAALHRGEDDACRRHLAALPCDSAPARLVPAIAGILDDETPGLPPPAQALVEAVLGARPRLRRLLVAIDCALSDGNVPKDALRAAGAACRSVSPALLAALHQQIAAVTADGLAPYPGIAKALGSTLLCDAAFWRLLAHTKEREQAPVDALLCWEHFRRHAIFEGLFAAESTTHAALRLRIGRLIANASPDFVQEELEDLCRLGRDDLTALHGSQPPERRPINAAVARAAVTELELYEAATHFAEAARLDPCDATFAAWVEGVSQEPEALTSALTAWSEARPEALAPRLRLAELAEARGASRQAATHLEAAESLAPGDPEVRAFRLRMAVRRARRNALAGHVRALATAIAELEERPEAKRADVALLVQGLQAVHASLDSQPDAFAAHQAALARQLGAPAAVELLLATLGIKSMPRAKGRAREPSLTLLADVARVCQAASVAALPVALSGELARELAAQARRRESLPDPPGLLLLAQAALAADAQELAYQISGALLDGPSDLHGRALMLRGRCLPRPLSERRRLCFAAAVSLARRARDLGLLGEAVDAAREAPRAWHDPLGAELSVEDLDDDTSAAVLARERRPGSEPHWPGRKQGRATSGPRATKRGGVATIDPAPHEPDEIEWRAMHPRSARGLPPGVLALLLEASIKWGRPAGAIPASADLRRLDPALHARIVAAWSSAPDATD